MAYDIYIDQNLVAQTDAEEVDLHGFPTHVVVYFGNHTYLVPQEAYVEIRKVD